MDQFHTFGDGIFFKKVLKFGRLFTQSQLCPIGAAGLGCAFCSIRNATSYAKTQAETQDFIIVKPCSLTMCFKPCSLTMIKEIDKAIWSLFSMVIGGVATQWL